MRLLNSIEYQYIAGAEHTEVDESKLTENLSICMAFTKPDSIEQRISACQYVVASYDNTLSEYGSNFFTQRIAHIQSRIAQIESILIAREL
jgi:hypothetical protein